MKKRVLAMAGLFLGACSSGKNGTELSYKEDSALHREWQPVNIQKVSEICVQLRPGDIVLRTGADATSHMLRGMNQRDATYSHCGIVAFEDGQPFIYHAIGGEDNPDARIRRDPAADFFAPLSNEGGAILRVPFSAVETAAVIDTARAWYRQARRFDLAFDLATDSSLYCAEYVSKAIHAAVARDIGFTVSHLNGFDYIATDNLTAAPSGKIIWPFRFQ